MNNSIIEPHTSENPIIKSNQSKKTVFEKIWRIFFIGVLLVGLIVLVWYFLATPSQVKGAPIEPFKKDQYLLSEKITYLLREPRVNDRVLFLPIGSEFPYIGIIINIDRKTKETKYIIQSTAGKPWIITRNQIKRKIYYPLVSEEEIKKIVTSLKKTLSPTPTPTVIPGFGPTIFLLPTSRLGQPTAQPTKIPTSLPSATPTVFRDATGPTVTIQTGPENGSTISFKDICFTISVSDNVSKYPQLYIRTKFDSDIWSDWSKEMAPCYQNLTNGSHNFSVQAKDEAGNVSEVLTRSFIVQLPQDITITLSGQVYRDVNCNGIKETGEGGVSNTTVNLFQMPQFYLYGTVVSDNNGNYNFSKTIKENESVTLKPNPVSSSGYKANPKFDSSSFTLSSSNKSASQDIPQVPNENIDQCQL